MRHASLAVRTYVYPLHNNWSAYWYASKEGRTHMAYRMIPAARAPTPLAEAITMYPIT